MRDVRMSQSHPEFSTIEFDLKDVPEGFRHIFFQPGNQFLFRHAHRLARHSIKIGDLLQGFRFLSKQPALKDNLVPPGKRFFEFRELGIEQLTKFSVRDLVIHALIHEVESVDVARVVVVSGDGSVQGQIGPRHSAFHVQDLLFVNTEVFRQKASGGSDSLGLEFVFLFTEIHEDLAPLVRGPNLHQSRVVEQKLENVCLDPPCCICRQARAARSIEALQRLKQSDVSFLNEIEEVVIDLAINHRDFHDEFEIRGNQAIGSFAIAGVAVAHGEIVLFLPAERTEFLDLVQIPLERVIRCDPVESCLGALILERQQSLDFAFRYWFQIFHRHTLPPFQRIPYYTG